MKRLSKEQSEEREKSCEQIDTELQAQGEQMNNMPQENMEQTQPEGQQFMKENQEIKNQCLAVQNSIEKSLKKFEKLSKSVARQAEDEDKEKAGAEKQMQQLLENTEVRHSENKKKVRIAMESKMEAQRQTLTAEYQRVAQSRMGVIQDRQGKLEEVAEQLEGVKEHGEA